MTELGFAIPGTPALLGTRAASHGTAFDHSATSSSSSSALSRDLSGRTAGVENTSLSQYFNHHRMFDSSLLRVFCGAARSIARCCASNISRNAPSSLGTRAHGAVEFTAVCSSLAAVAVATELSAELRAMARSRRAAAACASGAPAGAGGRVTGAPSGCTHQLGVGASLGRVASSAHGTRGL